MKRLSTVATICLLTLAFAGVASAQYLPASPPSNISRGLGRFYAPNYAFGFGGIAPGRVVFGNNATGSQTITLQLGLITLPDGRTDMPFNVNAPLLIGNGTNQETVTPTAVSGCYEASILSGSQGINCTITGSFNNLHGQGEIVQSGTYGLQEAINDAFTTGGGVVVVDTFWGGGYGSPMQGTTAILAAATPYLSVFIEDDRGPGAVQYWTTQQTASTFLAAPAVLTAGTFTFSTTPAGSYTTAAAYFACVSYVDVAGQEGPCSTTQSQTPGTTLSSATVTAPVASAGAVGYTIYISLTSGTYSLSYEVPLTSAICTLTKVETVTPACAVANSTYGQAASNAVVTALTLATSPVDPQLGGVSGTLLTPNAGGRTTYGYVPSSHVGATGILAHSLAFTAGGIGSATPISIGSVNIAAGVMNTVGKEIRICGKYLNTDVNSSTQIIDVYWDAAGSNSAGSPVKLSALTETGTGTAAAYEGSFCETFTTTVSGAGATAGSILPGFANLSYALVSTGAVVGTGQDTVAAAVASLNLANTATAGFTTRLNIVHNNATGNATPQLQDLTIEIL